MGCVGSSLRYAKSWSTDASSGMAMEAMVSTTTWRTSGCPSARHAFTASSASAEPRGAKAPIAFNIAKRKGQFPILVWRHSVCRTDVSPTMLRAANTSGTSTGSSSAMLTTKATREATASLSPLRHKRLNAPAAATTTCTCGSWRLDKAAPRATSSPKGAASSMPLSAATLHCGSKCDSTWRAKVQAAAWFPSGPAKSAITLAISANCS
mmetsp:Transcript_47324/g.101319  ORF Transcript_47324/g.101319 Transcript_47324/m.101319 type:complete len:209 (+) Transcript_47324:442-1068(+)